MNRNVILIRNLVITSIFLLLVPSQLIADQKLESELAKCVGISGDLERLDCFESTLRKRGLMPTETSQKSTMTKWVKQVNVNPLDDTKTVYLALEADSGGGRFGGKVVLLLRCKSNKTEAFINWQDYLGSDNARVTFRIGSASAETKSWSLSTDSKATFIPSPIDFIKNLMTANSFVAQVTPYNESPVTAVFDTSGLDQEIKELRSTCGW